MEVLRGYSWWQSLYVACVGRQTPSWPLFSATSSAATLRAVAIIQDLTTGRPEVQWGGCAKALGSSMWCIRCQVASSEVAQWFRGLSRLSQRHQSQHAGPHHNPHKHLTVALVPGAHKSTNPRSLLDSSQVYSAASYPQQKMLIWKFFSTRDRAGTGTVLGLKNFQISIFCCG